MAKMVGYACNIRDAWMKYARQLLSEGLSLEAYKANLNECPLEKEQGNIDACLVL